MVLNILILFFSAFLAGIGALFLPIGKRLNFKLALVFAGAYLFSITIIHILPELFAGAANPSLIGIFVLIGFFLQLFLEYFTSGVEHGHIHNAVHKNHKHVHISPVFLLLALCVHAFLEGTLLSHPSETHQHSEVRALLLGIVLHKMPAAFALMSVLLYELGDKKKSIIYLIIFCFASPVGLLLSEFSAEKNLLPDHSFTILYALVSGNFLHISTTIFFESSPEHKFNAKKLFVSVLGALIAIAAEYYM